MTDSEDRMGPIAETALNEIVSLAQASGYFDRVNQHEPKSAPGSGLSFAAWVQEIKPIALQSGLATTTARMTVQTRVYSNMTQEPQDLIDINLTKSVTWMMAQYTGNFAIDADAWIDLLGAYGVDLSSIGGYVELGGKMFRIMDTLIPFIAEDVWTQGQEA